MTPHQYADLKKEIVALREMLEERLSFLAVALSSGQ